MWLEQKGKNRSRENKLGGYCCSPTEKAGGLGYAGSEVGWCVHIPKVLWSYSPHSPLSFVSLL